jgi:glycine betaine catabolism A
MVSQTGSHGRGPVAAQVGLNAPAPPAPIDPRALAATLAPFGQSRMLPREAYVDEDVFEWEREHFFTRGWLCVGLSGDLAAAGDQRAEWVGNGGVLLTRDETGEVHAFANVCRHRGHELLPCGASAHHGRIICPYHSWSYGLDGALWTAAGFKDQVGFDRAEYGLVSLPVEVWHGMIFVDASGTAAPLEDGLGGLEALVAPYEPERLQVAARHDYEVASNWKTLTENYHECYHCPVIHPQLCEVSPPKSGENYDDAGTWIGGWMDLRQGVETMSLDGRSGSTPLRNVPDEDRRKVVYVNIFPNILVSLHPDYVMTHRLTPLAADRTRIECTWAFDPDAAAEPGFDPSFAVDFWDITNRQDWLACESVQRGLTSPHAVPGPLSSEEEDVYRYVTMVARAYLGQPVRNRSLASAV